MAVDDVYQVNAFLSDRRERAMIVRHFWVDSTNHTTDYDELVDLLGEWSQMVKDAVEDICGVSTMLDSCSGVNIPADPAPPGFEPNRVWFYRGPAVPTASVESVAAQTAVLMRLLPEAGPGGRMFWPFLREDFQESGQIKQANIDTVNSALVKVAGQLLEGSNAEFRPVIWYRSERVASDIEFTQIRPTLATQKRRADGVQGFSQ